MLEAIFFSLSLIIVLFNWNFIACVLPFKLLFNSDESKRKRASHSCLIVFYELCWASCSMTAHQRNIQLNLMSKWRRRKNHAQLYVHCQFIYLLNKTHTLPKTKLTKENRNMINANIVFYLIFLILFLFLLKTIISFKQSNEEKETKKKKHSRCLFM